jgi:heme-degrading monooxygenase HmoA
MSDAVSSGLGRSAFPQGTIAVIFSAQRSNQDEAGYQAAALAMEHLAAQQPGYCGMEHARGPDGFGITISYWRDDRCARDWRDHPEHQVIREQGRNVWYTHYRLHVARVERGYHWP